MISKEKKSEISSCDIVCQFQSHTLITPCVQHISFPCHPEKEGFWNRSLSVTEGMSNYDGFGIWLYPVLSVMDLLAWSQDDYIMCVAYGTCHALKAQTAMHPVNSPLCQPTLCIVSINGEFGKFWILLTSHALSLKLDREIGVILDLNYCKWLVFPAVLLHIWLEPFVPQILWF